MVPNKNIQAFDIMPAYSGQNDSTPGPVFILNVCKPSTQVQEMQGHPRKAIYKAV